jgi:hypothetical protein
MRTALIVAVLSTAGCAGTNAPKLNVEGDPARKNPALQSPAATYAPKFMIEGHPAQPWTYEGDAPDVSGSISWYSAADLDRISRDYVRAKNIDFSFKGTEAQFWVARDREYMARGSYSSGLGEPVLDLEIGWNGYVKKHSIGFAVCGTVAGASAP